MYIINYILQFEEKRRKEKRHCHRTHRHEEFARHISYLDPSTHDGHFEKIYRTTYTWLRPRTNFRVWPGSRLDKMAPRNPCWRRYTPFSTWSGRSYSTAAGRALACTWTRKIVACERVCVGHVHTRALVERWRGEGGYLEYVSRYASLSCIGTSRVSLSSVETQRAGRVVSEVRLNWKFYS